MADIYIQSSTGQTTLINEGEFTIGRHTANPIVIEGEGVSRQHARIIRTGNQIFIVDLNSSNGTYLNDKRLSPNVNMSVNSGDKIGFGKQVTFILHNSLGSTTMDDKVEVTLFNQNVNIAPDPIIPQVQQAPPMPVQMHHAPQVPAPPVPAPPNQQVYVQQQLKTDSTDTITQFIETIFGIFGLVGVGWLYVGNFKRGFATLIGFMVLLMIEIPIIIFSAGLCGCIIWPLNISAVVISGLQARDYVRQTGAKGTVLNVVLAVVGGYIAIAVLILFFFSFIGLAAGVK
jgi:pSer/pThr/pTyr-binding forkhead associated (FHA) protein